MSNDNSGWIKVYRKLQDNPLWKSEPFSRGQAWIDLLLLANHKDSYFFLRGNKVSVKRGELAWPVTKLATRWKWSKGKVSRFLNLLEIEQQIELKKSNLINTIIIKNYSDYQQIEQQTGQQIEQQTGQQTDTYKNDKNIKNDKEIDIYLKTFNKILDKNGRMNNSRKNKIKQFSKKFSIEDFERAMQRVLASDFLQYKWTNWSFDWFMNEANFTKVIEGTYDNATTQKHNEQNNQQGGKPSTSQQLASGISRIKEKYGSSDS